MFFIDRVIFVWVNERDWRHLGPIVNIARVLAVGMEVSFTGPSFQSVLH
jgi:hypothetical protein